MPAKSAGGGARRAKDATKFISKNHSRVRRRSAAEAADRSHWSDTTSRNAQCMPFTPEGFPPVHARTLYLRPCSSRNILAGEGLSIREAASGGGNEPPAHRESAGTAHCAATLANPRP